MRKIDTIIRNLCSTATDKNEVVDVGSKACMTLFNPKNKYIFTKSHVRSKSKNASFINSEIKGKVYGVINNGCVVLDE